VSYGPGNMVYAGVSEHPVGSIFIGK